MKRRRVLPVIQISNGVITNREPISKTVKFLSSSFEKELKTAYRKFKNEYNEKSY